MKKWWVGLVVIFFVGAFYGLSEGAPIKVELQEYRELDNKISDKYNKEFQPLVGQLNHTKGFANKLVPLYLMRKVMTEIQELQSSFSPKSTEVAGLSDRSIANSAMMLEGIGQMIQGCESEDVGLFNQGIGTLNQQLGEKQKIGDEAFRLARANRLNWVEQ